MIEYIKGSIIDRKSNYLLVLCNDIGYGINISDYTYDLLRNTDDVELFCYMKVREDAIELFGFISIDEKKIFLLLNGVSGIGSKTALNLLSKINYQDIYRFILEEDINLLATAPGIGKKTAKKIVLELKDKFQKTSIDNLSNKRVNLNTGAIDSINALIKLGFKKQYAEDRVNNILNISGNKNLTTQEIITLALKNSDK